MRFDLKLLKKCIYRIDQNLNTFQNYILLLRHLAEDFVVKLIRLL